MTSLHIEGGGGGREKDLHSVPITFQRQINREFSHCNIIKYTAEILARVVDLMITVMQQSFSTS